MIFFKNAVKMNHLKHIVMDYEILFIYNSYELKDSAVEFKERLHKPI